MNSAWDLSNFISLLEMLVYIQLQLLNSVLSNRASLGLSRQHSCNKLELTVLMSATSSPGEDLQQDVLQQKMSVVVYLIQPDENHSFTAWIRLKWVISAWKVCRWEWQVKPEWLLLWREVWFLSNSKDRTVAQLGMLLSSYSLLCFFSNFTLFEKEKGYSNTQSLRI